MSVTHCVAIAALLAAGGQVYADVVSTVVNFPSAIPGRIVHVRPDAPLATLMVFAGDDGSFGITDDGTLAAPTGRCSPVARNRQAYVDRGYALAFVDSRYGMPMIQQIVDYLRTRDPVPIWLFSGGASSPYLANLAIELPAALPLGVIFFSPADVDPVLPPQIRRATQVVAHQGDVHQRAGPLFAGLTSAPIKERVTLTGGTDAICGFHMFQGIDASFVATTAGFIDKYNATLGDGAGAGVPAVEFYNAGLDHYFLTHVAGEIALLDAGTTIKGWTRTGQSFNVYPTAQTGSSPVCRYYIPPGKGDSHFYGRGTAECNATGAANPTFVNEDPQFFHVMLPAAGVCPAGTRNVYRTFSNRADANHRYMVDSAIRDQMVGKGWLAEGDGPNLVVMCAPA